MQRRVAISRDTQYRRFGGDCALGAGVGGDDFGFGAGDMNDFFGVDDFFFFFAIGFGAAGGVAANSGETNAFFGVGFAAIAGGVTVSSGEMNAFLAAAGAFAALATGFGSSDPRGTSPATVQTMFDDDFDEGELAAAAECRR